MSIAVCAYLNERNVYPDGCVYIRAQGIASYFEFLCTIKKALSGPVQLAGWFKKVLSDSSQLNSPSDCPDNDLRKLEEFVANFLAPLKVLLIIDHADDIILSANDGITDLRMFLSHFFEKCKNLKILMTSTQLICSISF